MIETVLLSIAMTLYPVTIPSETIWLKEYDEVRPVLDKYFADNGILPVGLSVKVGDTCFIYAFPGETKRAKEIYLHETAHCWGLNHEQIDVVLARMNLL